LPANNYYEAVGLINRLLGFMSKLTAVEAIWHALDDIELVVKSQVLAEFSEWHAVVRTCEELGMLAPMVPSQNSGDFSLITAGPFLKRALNDLRAVWLLIERGYSTQAASVAASLYENALTAAAIAGNDKLAREAKQTKYAEIPWTPKRLAQLNARREISIREKPENKLSNKEYEDAWTISYFNYKWLCQIKHPTWQAVYHDIQGSLINNVEYAIRPGPNNIADDKQLKARILGVSLSQTFIAARSFFLALSSDVSSAEYQAFESKANFVHTEIRRLIKREYGKPSPISVLNRSFIKTDFETLRKYDE
jgi:hypothetical protein